MRASSPLIGGLKWICAQVIVAHHFASYGPLAQRSHADLPALFDPLSGYGAWVVSVFFVISGFLSAQGLKAQSVPIKQFGTFVCLRFLRLTPIYYLAIGMAVGIAYSCRPLLSPDFVPPAPGFLSSFAHLFFLQDVLGLEALSAGLWYVCIDFQLFTLFLLIRLMTSLANHPHEEITGILAWAALGWAALFYFNTDKKWDVWGIYFAGVYALGALSFEATTSKLKKNIYLLFILGAVLSWWLEPRPRLFIGICTSMALFVIHQCFIQTNPFTHWMRQLGDSSYALFLSHFSLLMLINACFVAMGGSHANIMIWFAFFLLIGNLWGWLLWRYIDMPTVLRIQAFKRGIFLRHATKKPAH